jgi:hypothetical protein
MKAKEQREVTLTYKEVLSILKRYAKITDTCTVSMDPTTDMERPFDSLTLIYFGEKTVDLTIRTNRKKLLGDPQ